MLSLRISELRNGKKLSQADMARYLNMSQQTYSSYEIGRHQMNYETLCQLAGFFGVSTDYILGRDIKMPSYLTAEERERIEQYRALDGRGRETVDMVLELEASRSRRLKGAKKPAM
jgi:transcriptional regulator with XRE-family HTH domain